MCDYLMTGGAATVCKCASGNGDELPVIAGGMQGQLQYAIAGTVLDLTGRQNTAEVIVISAARADHELAHPLWIGLPVRVHRGEALIVVFVAVEDQFGTGIRQDLPECFILWIAAMMGP